MRRPSARRAPSPPRWRRRRATNLGVLAGLTSADLDRAGRHPEYGMIPLRVILNAWTAHDLQHTVQAEEAMMQEFIPETGPFRFRFADHDVAVRS
jgi:hypothetical protein